MRAAAVQLNSTTDQPANLRAAERLVREAADRGADLVLLPEKWPLLGPGEALRAGAQELDGPVAEWATALAAELRIDLIAGSLSERVPGEERIANTSLHLTPAGAVAASYRKVHMFDVEVDGQAYRESAHELAGEHLTLTTLAGGAVVGMSVCYDLRFPELYRALAVAGAQVLVVPAAFTLATTRDHWEVLLRARAIENQCFVVAANQIGEHAPGLRSGGRSMIVDPWGIVLAQAPDGEGLAVADLDLGRLEQIRSTLPSLASSRPEAYVVGAPAGSTA